MARLINADYLLCALGLDDMTEADGYNMDLMRSDIRDAINDAPTVDAVEVVRCEDCAKSRRIDGDIKRFCRKTKTLVMPRGYCGYGRKCE